MTCICGHDEDEHYGTDDKNCNHPGCHCLKLGLNQPAKPLEEVMDEAFPEMGREEKIKKPKRGGWPKGKKRAK